MSDLLPLFGNNERVRFIPAPLANHAAVSTEIKALCCPPAVTPGDFFDVDMVLVREKKGVIDDAEIDQPVGSVR